MGFDHLHHSKRKNAGENVIRQQAAVSASFNGNRRERVLPAVSFFRLLRNDLRQFAS
jgi:hypothetical protein